MTATIVCDAMIAVVSKEEHLRFPVIAVQRPAMGEDDGLSGRVSPVLVVDLRLVFGNDERHSVWLYFAKEMRAVFDSKRQKLG